MAYVRGSLVFAICIVLTLAILCLTYYPWVNGMIHSEPEKIRNWFPHLADIWLSVRGYLRPAITLILLAEITLLLLFGLYRIRKKVIVLVKHVIRWIPYGLYVIGAVVVLLVIINLVCYSYLRASFKLEDAEHELGSIVVREPFLKSAQELGTDSLYILENISDNVRYTFYSNGEFQYYPRLESVHGPFRSKHINVGADSFDLPNRLTPPIACKAAKSIYCFGGSTTFGTLISDRHTWPSFLQELYKDSSVCVQCKNYGSCGHNASHATFQFLELLRLGHRPSVAIFLDGINMGPPFDGCEYSQGIAERFQQNALQPDRDVLLSNIPMVRIFQHASQLDNTGLTKSEPFNLILPVDSVNNNRYANRLIENARLRTKIGEMYGVKVVNILQPSVYYSYKSSFETDRMRQVNNQSMKNNCYQIYSKAKESGAFTDMSNLFLEYNKPAIIDILHYSPDFNKFLAAKIASTINVSELPDFSLKTNEAETLPFRSN